MAYCEKKPVTICPFCKSSLKEAQITEEKLDGTIIEWLTIETLRIGLVGFERIPTSLAPILSATSVLNETSQYRVVLFPSKRSSWKMANCFRKSLGKSESAYHKIFDRSRYTLVEDPRTKKRYILLNLEAVDSGTVGFLISFLNDLFSQINKLRELNVDITVEALAKGLFHYVQSIGIPFVMRDEELEDYFEIIRQNLPGIYAEYAVLKNLSKGYTKEILDFLSHKYDLLFSGIDHESLVFLRGVYEVINAYIQISSLLALAQEHEPLRKYVNSVFYSKQDKERKELGDFPDINECFNIIVETLSQKEAYVSYESYLKSVSRVLETVLRVLRPRYIRIGEVDALFEISQRYEWLIEKGEEPYIPKFGSINDFCQLLSRLFHRKDVYPELRIMAGQFLQGILMFRIWKESNYAAYLQGLGHVQELAQLIVDNIQNIGKRLGRTYSQHGRALEYNDACLLLTSFTQFCHIMNDEDSALKLIGLSKQIEQDHDVIPARIVHSWKDFVETHDYDKLLSVYDSFSAIDYDEYNWLEEQLKTLGHLASAIFKKGVRKNEFKKAEDHALAMANPTPPKSMPTSYFAQAVQNSIALCHLIHLFQQILDANETNRTSSLKEAFLESQAISACIPEIDPLNKFALKTEILYALASGDLVRVREVCGKLKKQSMHAPKILQFVDNVENWLSESSILNGRRFLIRLDIDESDPWEKLLKKMTLKKMNEDLERNIVGADAVVFVEGLSDARIFERFAMTLIPSSRIVFLDVEGFTNMHYYSQAKIAKALQLPLFILFDGDTSTIQRKKRIKNILMKQISLPQNHILTLKKNSIEDYLLVPTAIKRAFPSALKSVEDIGTFLKLRKTKRNKRSVLQDLFAHLGLGKYDYKKAVCIVSKMRISEIDDEIKQVLNRVTRQRMRTFV